MSMAETNRRSVQLASTISSPLLPTTIFIHGLDSSKETWAGTLSRLNKIGYPAIALDLRGHGESALGKATDFTPENLAQDILDAVEEHGVRSPYVLVGHSMGGRIAMQLAAIEVEECARCRRSPRLAACVIEDMDTQIRMGATPTDESLDLGLRDQLKSFQGVRGRAFDSWEQCRNALLPCKYSVPKYYLVSNKTAAGYNNDAARVDGWRGNRVRQLPDGSWWSDINPVAHRLARQHVLASPHAAAAWDRLAAAHRAAGSLPFPVHVWVAGREGTVCRWDGPGGIADMAARLPAATVREFPGAGHSIHNESISGWQPLPSPPSPDDGSVGVGPEANQP